MLEEWKLHNLLMEEDLPEDVSASTESVGNVCHDKDGTSDDQGSCNTGQDCISVSSSCMQVKLT